MTLVVSGTTRKPHRLPLIKDQATLVLQLGAVPQAAPSHIHVVFRHAHQR